MAKATQLAQAFWGLMKASNLISLQTSSCESNKYTTSKYLAKNNNNSNGSIQIVSDEDKRTECHLCITVHGVGRKVFKMKCQGQQNTSLIFRRIFKHEKMKLFPSVSYLNPLAVTAWTQSVRQQRTSSFPSFRRFSGDSHRTDFRVNLYFVLL